MPSTIWTGSISFGLVAVPVRLVSATRSHDVRFHQLDPDTNSRIRYRRVSEASGDEVPREQIKKGYEFAPGQYVTVEPDEMDALAPKSTKAIDIEDFVDLADIDPVFFEQPYYLVPDKETVKPYRLLVETMTEMGKVAVGRFVLRSKEHLVAIRPVEGVLCLEMMRYADEVVAPSELEGIPGEKTEVTDRELKMAKQLVDSLAAEFEPDKYHDEYREQLQELLEKKAKGEEIIVEPAAEEPGEVVDLMAALEESLARSKKARDAPAKKTTKKAAKKRKSAYGFWRELRRPTRREPRSSREHDHAPVVLVGEPTAPLAHLVVVDEPEAELPARLEGDVIRRWVRQFVHRDAPLAGWRESHECNSRPYSHARSLPAGCDSYARNPGVPGFWVPESALRSAENVRSACPNGWRAVDYSGIVFPHCSRPAERAVSA